jgi:NAD+ synthase (glutamine-hydrolysing)
MAVLRIALCQLNPKVGDLAGNTSKVIDAIRRAEALRCDVAVFGELSLTGYPPEDLLLKHGFLDDADDALDQVVAATDRCAAVVGFPERDGHGRLFNSAMVAQSGDELGVYRKRMLPNTQVFDERRYFVPGHGDQPAVFTINGVRVGVSICEDAWHSMGPIPDLADAGAELIVNINASPFYAGRLAERIHTIADRVGESGLPIVYVNQVGGQDELVFDGGSFVLDETGTFVAEARQFVEDLMVVSYDTDTKTWGAPPLERGCGDVEEVYEALVLGTRDYVHKNGFTDVVIGMSGGVDSSLVAAIAADALGPAHVHGVLMPSRYSSDGSITDAERLCTNFGIDHRIIAIEPAHTAFADMLAPSFEGRAADLTEENLQSRIRGVTLMALSNKLNWLVLTTGNKSETSVGYSTLYGDTAGGFAVIKDCPKLLVYELCRWRNRQAPEVAGGIIPESVLVKPPSAELRPDQRDDQSLPPYDELDPILEAYIEDDQTAAEMIEEGFDPALVARITRLIDLAEYKRRQSPPGPRVSPKAFGKDRRIPITNGYRG